MKLIEDKIKEIQDNLQIHARTDSEIDEVEKALFSDLMSFGKILMDSYLEEKESLLADSAPLQSDGLPMENKGVHTRNYETIFGLHKVSRDKFYDSSTKKVFYPLDKAINLPLNQYSYHLMDLLGEQSSELSYSSSVKLLNKLRPIKLQGKQSQRLSEELSEQVESFYNSTESAITTSEQKEGVNYVCLQVDKKGIPMVKDCETVQVARLKKGEKRGTKQQATVHTVFDFQPVVRDKQVIINALFRIKSAKKDKKTDKLKAVNLHRRGFMSKQKENLHYGVDQVKRRFTKQTEGIVVLSDGGQGFEQDLKGHLANVGLKDKLCLYLIDIIHVSEYVWQVANIVCGNQSDGRQFWVRRVLEDLLESKVEKVIKDFTTIKNQSDLSKEQKQKIQSVLTYLENQKHKMDYKQALEKGFPVTTAIVEGGCKYLVGDRMNKSGMRWKELGAQAMLDIRAVSTNGDWQKYIKFFKKQQNKKRAA